CRQDHSELPRSRFSQERTAAHIGLALRSLGRDAASSFRRPIASAITTPSKDSSEHRNAEQLSRATKWLEIAAWPTQALSPAAHRAAGDLCTAGHPWTGVAASARSSPAVAASKEYASTFAATASRTR